MSRTVVVLRPEPGNAATATALRSQGISVRALPLFAVVPVAWTPPDPAGFDAILLTSANAVRHGGAGLDGLKALPVIAVGEATARIARGAGFAVTVIGTDTARSAIDAAHDRGLVRLLHLAGRERSATGAGVVAVTLYASDPLPIDDDAIRACEGAVAMLHSPRAARDFAGRVTTVGADRARMAIVALSQPVADAAGAGWASIAVADAPRDDALVDLAANVANGVIDPAPRGGDKRVMSDYVPIENSQARRPRLGIIIALIGLAFIAGLGLMGYAMKSWSWFGATPRAAVAATKTASGNPDYTPSLPLNANGEAPAAAPIDTAVLATREAALAGQLAALEARTAAVTIDAQAAAGQATRAEGLMVAFAARRAIDRGVGLGYLEEQVRLRFGTAQPRATAAILEAARAPVTLEDLRQGLDSIAPSITSVTGAENADWLTTVRREIGNLVVLRQEGVPSPMPADRLARARRLLEGGQVEAARAEVARLPGADQAGNWMDAARRYVLARQALDTIENTALIGQPGQPQPAPVVMTAPAVAPVSVQTPATASAPVTPAESTP